jgi:AMIN domain
LGGWAGGPELRGIAGSLVGALLLAGCAASAPTSGPASGPAASGSRSELSPAQLRQTVEDLGREVRDLRAQVEASRRVAVGYQDLAGLRAELEAVQAALQALIRDLDQRQLEGFQAVDRRLATIGGRISELASATRRADAGAGERQPGSPADGPPAPAPAPARTEAPSAPPVAPPPATAAVTAPAEPTREPAEGASRGRTIQRVSSAEASGETRVSIQADGPLTPRASVLMDPPRVVLDFENAAFGFGRTPVEVDGPLLERIRFIQLQGAPAPVIRLLLTLKRSVPYWIESQARGLVVHLGSTAPR